MRTLARACIRHRRVTAVAWIAVMVASIAAALVVGKRVSENFELPDTDSKAAIDLLEERFERTGDSVQGVLEARGGSFEDAGIRQEAERALDRLSSSELIAGVDSPFDRSGGSTGPISPDGRVALADLRLEKRAFDVQPEEVDELVAVAEGASSDRLRIELGGPAISNADAEPGGTAELVGLVAAIIILLITFGSVVAMGLPIVTAILALGTALSLVTLQTNLIDTADFATPLAAMIGLGAGIDYALFIVTRHRAGLKAGLGVNESIEVAMDSAGRAVLFAGATVVVSLLGLFAVGVSFLYGPALAAALAVILTMATSVTFLPALLSKVGTRIDRFRLPGVGVARGEEGAGWARWSRTIQRRPWPAAILSTAALLALAIPVLQIDLGVADAGTDEPGSTSREAYNLLAEGFGPGFNGPLQIVTDLRSGGSPEQLGELRADLAGTRGVAAASRPQLNEAGDAGLIVVFPTTSPQEQATSRLVDRLRRGPTREFDSASGATTHVGGRTAIFDDFAELIASKLPLFFGVVISLSALVLLAAFRSVPVAIKAVVMNALSIGASFGAVVLIFQLGYGNELIGVSETAPIEPFLPVMVFAIVFGLSMDYEVFLISRVHEEWERDGDASAAVQHGLASTARVITAAATIMIAVFASFALQGDRTITLFGVALATAIAIDAFVIRTLLVPAAMELLGERAWWIPGWLDRRLPKLQIEGAKGDPAQQGGAPREGRRAQTGEREAVQEG